MEIVSAELYVYSCIPFKNMLIGKKYVQEYVTDLTVVISGRGVCEEFLLFVFSQYHL